MKTLILVRHAKSDWGNETLTDAERPLNDRGKRDAPEMAKRTRKKLPGIDLLVASAAKRAKKTALLFAEEYKYAKEDIRIEPTLYEAPVAAYTAVLVSLPDKADTVALFAHNPTITDYANSLCNVHTDNIPTCGVFAVQAAVGTWAEFAQAEKKFLFYDYPKKSL
ncbi:MAG TPA: histidine phosphatase family protein [Flavisolibacter sp.]|jgi:phosphohistidine phosphatase|nr:histidine phosphatase family protein [Flavisolibacter sp.]